MEKYLEIFEEIFGKFLKKYLKNFQKIFEPKVFSDISQSAAPYKHHICYGKSFKKFNGGGVGWGGLFDYSVSPGPFLDLDLDLELDNIWKILEKIFGKFWKKYFEKSWNYVSFGL